MKPPVLGRHALVCVLDESNFRSPMSIKDLVKDTTVRFLYYRDKELWYEVVGKNFRFPVPIDDTGNATFLAEDKGMIFMRYIRKQMEAVALESQHERSLASP
jgi:hypothetical protein